MCVRVLASERAQAIGVVQPVPAREAVRARGAVSATIAVRARGVL